AGQRKDGRVRAQTQRQGAGHFYQAPAGRGAADPAGDRRPVRHQPRAGPPARKSAEEKAERLPAAGTERLQRPERRVRGRTLVGAQYSPHGSSRDPGTQSRMLRPYPPRQKGSPEILPSASK